MHVNTKPHVKTKPTVRTVTEAVASLRGVWEGESLFRDVEAAKGASPPELLDRLASALSFNLKDTPVRVMRDDGGEVSSPFANGSPTSDSISAEADKPCLRPRGPKPPPGGGSGRMVRKINKKF